METISKTDKTIQANNQANKQDMRLMRYAIWYHLHNSTNAKNTHGEVLLLVKLQANATKTLLKVRLHGCFSRFLYSAMVPNHAKHPLPSPNKKITKHMLSLT